ncbi:hypothetical protein IV498_15430 [Paenarthrobacter sp. Z7-10]|uniref:hypothetical protein n=1 Tax=Paenarthrobacter sp. Z7-10 TaxID=2787635 RepID=UPI0022A9B17C|nr:hypothetical protein [Paenarthrobacter sp. Z7-10]MCZ2404533.1 hypothetical protein [Paenarthrobacter sp. Z7-10]
MSEDRFVHKLMRATGRLRAIFGPAHSSPLDHEMTAENVELLRRRQAEAQQWETVTRPDGSTYVVAKNRDDKSLR